MSILMLLLCRTGTSSPATPRQAGTPRSALESQGVKLHPAIREVVRDRRVSVVMKKDGLLASLASVGQGGTGFKLKPVCVRGV